MDRERLTITLQKSVLQKVDSLIDRTKIRNRSHAIEYLITQSLTPKVTQAVILAGGTGLNMRPFTFEMPKGLFPVGGRPILEHIVEMLIKYEIRDIVFSIGHLGDKIKDHFGDGKKFGVRISYVSEDKKAGTGGALILARKELKDSPFLVVHGDILIDIDIGDFIAFHQKRGVVGTIALTSVVDPSSFGEVVLQGTRVAQFVEKPAKGKQKSQLVNCGLYVFEQDIFNFFPKKIPFRLEDVFSQIAVTRQLAGYLFAGRWVDIGTPVSYERAIRQWSKKIDS